MLLQALEREIVPRLLLAHSEPEGTAQCTLARAAPTKAEIDELARVAVESDLPAALRVVERMYREGMTPETVLLDLISAAARQLGEEWVEDSTTFTEVTVALGTLHQLVHTFTPQGSGAEAQHRGSLLLLAAPGEQHTLGLYTFGELLRRANFDVHIEVSAAVQDVLDLVARRDFLMVGISLSTHRALGAVAELIRDLKRTCEPRNIPVVLGGPLDLSEFARQEAVLFSDKDPRAVIEWLEDRIAAQTPGPDS